jgi:UDPglucose 6-dehydrogenase
MRKIAVIGTGYVGLVTGTCFAELGNRVACIDTDAAKIEQLEKGKIPFFEPGLHELVLRNRHSGRLTFHRSAAEGLAGSEVDFIAVGTPMGSDGRADLSFVRAAARDIAVHLDSDKIIVNKSTVPVETGDLVAAIVREHNASEFKVTVVSNPEFLREGSAISDFMQPDRIVLGSSDDSSAALMRELYEPLGAPILHTDVRTAEMIKYTANAFLATKISFINLIANICDEVGADIKDVVAGAGGDRRIGTAFFQAGLGFGGSCFPKDVMALARIAEASSVDPLILAQVLEINEKQVTRVVARLRERLGTLEGKRIGVFGLAFKANTDDIRESPAVRLVAQLLEAGAQMRVHDPVARETARATLGDGVTYVKSSYEAVDDADAIVVATDWNEYKQIDFAIVKKLMRGRIVYDARNIYDPERVTAMGLEYIGVGRGARRRLEAVSGEIVAAGEAVSRS